MEDIKSIFDSILESSGDFKNISMFIMSYFVNKGVLELHWDIDKQQFVFSPSSSVISKEESSRAIDADELLENIMKRGRK